jgi:hypothetical protein
MNTETTSAWEVVLPQNLDKNRAEAPDFTGQAFIGNSPYDVAGWFGTIGKGANKGRPYVGLQFTATGNVSSFKVTVSLWEKVSRTSETDPHFKTRDQLNGQDLKFSAWVETVGSLHQLRVLIAPYTIGPEDLSEAALETQARLASFLKEANLRLPNAQHPELPLGKPPHESKGRHRKTERDPDLDVEPSDIPF